MEQFIALNIILIILYIIFLTLWNLSNIVIMITNHIAQPCCAVLLFMTYTGSLLL